MPKAPSIDSAYFGNFVINGKRYSTDIILIWKGEVHERKKSHKFTKSELLNALMYEPEVIILGTGYSGLVEFDNNLIVTAKLHGAELIIKKTPEAVKEYNKLVRLGKKVIAILHSTC